VGLMNLPRCSGLLDCLINSLLLIADAGIDRRV